jgi:Tfp pilus assembly protein PilO
MRFISGIIFIVVAVGLFLGFTNPRYQQTKMVRDDVARFDEALTKAKELTALRDDLAATYNSFSTDEMGKLNTLLPDSIDTVRLIIDVDNIAKAHNLTLLNISVSGDSASTQAVGPDSHPYGTMDMSFNVSTTYEQFKGFLEDVERSLRILDVDSIAFGQPDAVGRTTYTVRARTYWLK